MRKNKLLLDLSIYEGLGLSPIESAMCGCIPVISNRGGNQSLEKYLGQNVPWITVKSSINFADILKTIDSANIIGTIEFRKNYEKVLSKLNFNKGAQELIALIK
jgi:glycosyltransferase involved in cell wall biosynthesis